MIKGVVYTRMGSPEVLKIQDIQMPIPASNQILVKVKASSLNASDYAQFEAPVKTGKVSAMFRIKEKLKDHKVGKVLGAEVSGIVEAVGADVIGFQKGDKVFGATTDLCGAWAEYVCLDKDYAALIPDHVTFEEAAAIAVAGTAALAAIHKADVQPNESVLVYGASGGVGQYAVQIAKAAGAVVTGVCSTRNLDMVRSLGASTVIDYTNEDFWELGEKYDVILGINGFLPLNRYKHSLEPYGRYIAVGGAKQGLVGGLFGPFASIGANQKLTFSTYFSEIKKHSVAHLKELAEQGNIHPVIDRVYPVQEVATAIRNAIIDHPQGKIIITFDK